MRPERQRKSKLPARFRDEDDPPPKRPKVTKSQEGQKKYNKMNPGPSSADTVDPEPLLSDLLSDCPVPNNNQVYLYYAQ